MNKLKINLLLGLAFFTSAAIPNPPDLGVGSYVLYEPTTKRVLVSFNADEPVQPASLTKLMTSYIVMETAKVSKVSSSERLLKKLQNCIEQRKVSSGFQFPIYSLVRALRRR